MSRVKIPELVHPFWSDAMGHGQGPLVAMYFGAFEALFANWAIDVKWGPDMNTVRPHLQRLFDQYVPIKDDGMRIIPVKAGRYDQARALAGQ